MFEGRLSLSMTCVRMMSTGILHRPVCYTIPTLTLTAHTPHYDTTRVASTPPTGSHALGPTEGAPLWDFAMVVGT